MFNPLQFYEFGKRRIIGFVSTWKTDNNSTGSSANNQVKLPLLSNGTYNFVVNWGDGISDTITAYNQAQTTHTYASIGTYTIKITGILSSLYFPGGDILKLIGISSWGYTDTRTDHSSAFQGVSNLTSFAQNIDWLNLIVGGFQMFRSSGLNQLPTTLSLNLLTNGSNMFRNTFITALPESMLLNSLSNGQSMFQDVTQLAVLPSNLTLNSLTNGAAMFRSTTITSLPSVMMLNSLTNGNGMFLSSLLSSLPSGITLNNLTNGSGMFQSARLTSVPSSLTLQKLNNGSLMFLGCTLTTDSYSQLLININANNTNTGITFHGGSSKYNSAGKVARDALTSRSPAWSITDGGLI